jgi:hypothetical protein
MKTLIRLFLSASIALTSALPASAQQYVFRYKQPLDASDTDPGVEDPGYGVGNDITVYFNGAIGYQFSKYIPVATKDVVQWKRSKGSYQAGLSLNASTGVISGIASGDAQPRNAVIIGYDVRGKAIARASINFQFHNPVGEPQNLVFYGHTGKYLYREIPATVNVARWEPLTPLPGDFQTEGRYLAGTPEHAYDESVSFIGFDYLGKEVAFVTGNLIVQDGPQVVTIADQYQHPTDRFSVSPSVAYSVGEISYRLKAFGGYPASLGFDPKGNLSGYIPTFNTSLRFQIEAVDVDGTTGTSNIFTLGTYAPDVEISVMPDLYATAKTPYALQLTGKDLSGQMNWQVLTGSLPTGLSLDPETGLISGTPVTEQHLSGLVISVATSDGGYGETKPFNFHVQPEGLVISFDAKNVRVNEAFATAGPHLEKGIIEPYSFSAAANWEASQSLSINYATAKVSGRITTAGRHDVPFNFTNGDGAQKTVLQPIGVYNPLALSFGSPVKFHRRTFGNALPTVAAQSVIGDAAFTVTGTLPEGLSFNPLTGGIYGTPKTLGTTSGLVVSIKDASNASAPSPAFDIVVEDRPAVEVSVGDVNVQRFVDNLVPVASAKNAYDGVAYELVAGSLPAGLGFDENGRITGSTSAAPGVYSGFRVKATDGEGYTATSSTFSITIIAPSNLENLNGGATEKSWTVGVPFSLQLPRPVNALGTVTYEIHGLPEGVSVVGDKLVGTIETLGASSFEMILTDETGRSLTATLTVNILEPMTASLDGSSPQASTFSLMKMASSTRFDVARGVGTNINAKVTNGIEPVVYNFAGMLPTGMSYENGVISGAPLLDGQTTSATLTITDAAGNVVTLPADFRVTARLPVDVAYDFSSALAINTSYSLPQYSTVKNAIGAVSYEISGALPAGVSFDKKTGVFWGIPTIDGRFPGIQVTATDSEGATYAGTYGPFEIGVGHAGPLGLATNLWFTVRAGESFLRSIPVSNGTKPILFATSDGGAMPHGLQLGSSDGSVSGTFSAVGTYNAAVTVSDDFGKTKTTTLQFSSVGPLQIAAPTTLAFSQYSTVAINARATNAIGGAYYQLISGTLPDGLTLEPSNGLISGTPKIKGTASNLVVQVTDSTGAKAQTPAFGITVNDRIPLAMDLATSYPVFANVGYKLSIPVSNAVGAVTFAQTGTLPDGIDFDPINGQFSGVASVIGTFPGISVTATDSVGGTVTKTFSLVVTTNGNPIVLSVADFVTKVGHPILTTAPTWSNTVGDVYLWADDTLGQYALAINHQTGIISGTARELMNFTPNVHVKDGTDRVTSKPINIKVIPRMVVNAPARIELMVNRQMQQVTPTFDNVVGTLAKSVEGAMPAGVTFDGTRFAGTPTEIGTFDVTVKGVDGLGDTGSSKVKIIVANNGQPPSISFTPAASGYLVTGAVILTPTYSNSKTGDVVTLAPDSQPLPPGMSIVKNASGLYDLAKAAGTNDEVGGYGGIKLRVTDKGGLYSETAPFAIIYTSSPALAYSNLNLSLRVGEPPAASPVVSAGKATADLNFAFQTDVTGGSLTINPSTGALSGSVSASGMNVVAVTESYAGRAIRTINYNVTFTVKPFAVSAGDIAAVIGTPLAAPAPTVTNGLPSGTWTLSGAPAWMSINPSTGALSGTPNASGNYQVTATFADTYGSASKTFTLSVSAGVKGYKYVKIIDRTYTTPYTYHRTDEVALFDEKGVNATSLGTIVSQSRPWATALDGNPATNFQTNPESATTGPTVVLQFPSPINFSSATGLGAIGGFNGYFNPNLVLRLQVFGSDDGVAWTEIGFGTGTVALTQKP